MANVFPKSSKLFNLTNDINCVGYNMVVGSRLKNIQTQYNNLNENEIIDRRGYYREVGVNGRGIMPSMAGARFTKSFPSKCIECSNNGINNEVCIKNDRGSLYMRLLNKKAYMFNNSYNKNVTSGPITYEKDGNIEILLEFGNMNGSGLTKNQQLSNLGKGLTLDGKPGKRLGVQSYITGTPILYSNSNINTKNNPIIVTDTNAFIKICN